MGRRSRQLLCISFALVAGCGGMSDNATVERDIARGLSEIESVHDRRVLQVRLTRLLVALRRDRATSESTRRARALAIRGFTAKLKSIAAEREFAENDSGEVAEATRDAARADAYRVLADTLLRAAEQALHP
ncbi:MAG TPA: hypothetical protein VFJ60_03335 [Gaiella sp.]|nr:hypothetical protein [Gaiella sp.]